MCPISPAGRSHRSHAPTPWRSHCANGALFGQPVDDDPPGTRPELGEDKPERLPGLWQRVGEYWWLGQDADNVR